MTAQRPILPMATSSRGVNTRVNGFAAAGTLTGNCGFLRRIVDDGSSGIFTSPCKWTPARTENLSGDLLHYSSRRGLPSPINWRAVRSLAARQMFEDGNVNLDSWCGCRGSFSVPPQSYPERWFRDGFAGFSIASFVTLTAFLNI